MAEVNNTSSANWSPALRAEMEAMTSTQRAAVLMLLLGEDQAADIIKYLSPKEVQALGAAMVQAAELSQDAVNVVLDEFVDLLKKQTSLSLGNSDYVENVMKKPSEKAKPPLFWAESCPIRRPRAWIF
jgi:flagellar motor switch protein FliG